ncbi:NAD(P)-dependent oxidoreductase [Bosea sp. (in: a-proteobacteria)]|uniref:NAD(P)-dependent oxidoreductase n=1 Tax=Bosea sp. (in: a-proteobacteria) TaxID=1871050 RepID=UPI002FCB2FA9
MSRNHLPVLIIGGSGVVGAQAAAALRRLHPDLPVTIAGRDLAKAQAVAGRLGLQAVAADLARPDLGLPEAARFGAVIVFVKDDWGHAQAYAQQRGIPHLSVSSGVFEIGIEAARFIHAPQAAPIVLASQWLAGAALFPALDYAKAYRSLDAIHVGVLLDQEDMGGRAALADYERITQAGSATLTLKDGRFAWISGEEAKARYRSVDGVDLPATAYGPLDVLSLATGTDAKNIRFDLAFDVSASRRRGEPFSTETVITLDGVLQSGERRRRRYGIVHPQGQAPLTALGVALATERALGMAGGEALKPGLYFPDSIVEPSYYVARMKEFGAVFSEGRADV